VPTKKKKKKPTLYPKHPWSGRSRRDKYDKIIGGAVKPKQKRKKK
jgi:hypothetical protein